MANGLLDDDSWLERLQRGYSGTTGLLNQQLGDYANQLNQARLAATEPVNQALGGYPRQAADALSSVSNVPGSEMMMPLPMTAFTARELGKEIPKGIKNVFQFINDAGMGNLNSPGHVKLMEQLASGELEAGLTKMAEKYEPSIIHPMSIQREMAGQSDAAYLPWSDTVMYDPGVIYMRAAEGDLPAKYLEQVMGHEIGHGALSKGMPSKGIKSLDPDFPSQLVDIISRQNQGLTNYARFRNVLDKLRGTELGDIFDVYFRGYPGESLLDRAKYWEYGIPQQRLPFEEYYADALGGRAANVGGTELLPIDWSYLDPFFK